MKNPYKIVHTIMVTEKSTELADDCGKYCFKVAGEARKPEIREAVETIFDVKVGSVNVMNMRGKKKRLRTAKFGKRPDWKKAIVTLKEGSIDLI
jgi:large subunit ribosomal protein L23